MNGTKFISLLIGERYLSILDRLVYLLTNNIAGICHCWLVAILINNENCYANELAVDVFEKYVWHAKNVYVCVCTHPPIYPHSLASTFVRWPWSHQRKAPSLLSIRKSLTCVSSSKLIKTNMYIARARCESQPAVVSRGLNVPHYRDGLTSLCFSSILEGSVGLWVGVQSAGEWLPQTPGF